MQTMTLTPRRKLLIELVKELGGTECDFAQAARLALKRGLYRDGSSSHEIQGVLYRTWIRARRFGLLGGMAWLLARQCSAADSLVAAGPALDTTFTWSHVLTIITAGAVMVGQWYVLRFQVGALKEKDTYQQDEIDHLKGELERYKEQTAKLPSLLCTIHEQRITKLEEDLKIQYVGLKSEMKDQFAQMKANLEMILTLMGRHHSHEQHTPSAE